MPAVTRPVMRMHRLSMLFAAAAIAALSACAPGLEANSGAPSAQYQAVNREGERINLAVREKGKGRPVLLLHGLGASSYTWRLIEDDLARTNRVIAIDLKGFGYFDKPLDGRYSITDQARLISNYINERNLRDVVIVGHSFGGAVALAAALSETDTGERRIARLVLIDAVAYRQPMPFFFQVLRTPLVGLIGMELVPPELQISEALQAAYYNERKIEDDTVKMYASPLHTEGGRHALFHTINSLEPDKADMMSSRYRAMMLPALLLWCDHDRIVPLEFGKKLAHDLPNARIEIIENCGHLPHEEQPTDTLRAIQRFIR